MGTMKQAGEKTPLLHHPAAGREHTGRAPDLHSLSHTTKIKSRRKQPRAILRNENTGMEQNQLSPDKLQMGN